MKKNIKNALDERLIAKLPESLSRENIMAELENIPVRETEAVNKRRRINVKGFIAAAASLAIVLGSVGAYFGMTETQKNAEPAPYAAPDSAEVVRFDDYSSIFDRFEKMQREYDNRNGDESGEVFMPEAAPGSKAEDTDALNAASPSEEKRGFGTTNLQEQGVDEGDAVKTDGRYLYVFNAYKSELAIIDCSGGKMQKLSATAVNKDGNEFFNGGELYLYGNYAVIAGMRSEDGDGYKKLRSPRYDVCAYAASADTAVFVYDISDRSSPVLVNSYIQQGDYLSSRLIGSRLYCISNYYVPLEGDGLKERCIPTLTVNDRTEKIGADCISVLPEAGEPTYAVIATLDLNNAKAEPSCEAILGGGETVYATVNRIYVSQNAFDGEDYTKLYKFDYTDEGVKFAASGKIKGTLINQFAMGEQGDYLRVAATDSVTVETTASPGADGDASVSAELSTENTLYILDKDMKTVGTVTGLADGERIESVRFVGNTAYIVTFYRTDPLFVIDTSDPYKPKLLGELKITGFSQYLHPYGNGFLIGVGNDGTENGTNGDAKISLFDVSNPAKPVEASKLTVMNGKGTAHSGVSYNHRLFINLPNGQFAVPFSTNSYIGSGGESTCYIHYAVRDGALKEIARYRADGINDFAVGGTYIGNSFYAIYSDYRRSNGDGMAVIAYDMTTGERLARTDI